MHLSSQSKTIFALGGNTELTFVYDFADATADKLMTEILKYIYRFEKRFSRFLPMSELSMFNKNAGAKTVISMQFREILITVKEMSKLTGGLYNPFILPALQRAGYIQSAAKGYENDPQEDFSNRSVVNCEKLKIGKDFADIPYGTAIDLGGCGKGFLADKLSEMLMSYNVAGFWISLSGDIATYGVDENGQDIYVAMQDADRLDSQLNLAVHSPHEKFAIATSGTFKRSGQNNSDKWHHIINPKTLKSAETDIVLATVCAPQSVFADVLASCAIVLGSNKAPQFLKSKGIENWFLQYRDKSQKIRIEQNGKIFEQMAKPQKLEAINA